MSVTSEYHPASVCSISGRAACIKLFGPRIRLAKMFRASLIDFATPMGSCSAIQPNLQPGSRNRLDKPDNVRMGMEEMAARGMKGEFQVYMSFAAYRRTI